MVENEELRARLAKYGQTIKAYHTPPSRKTITQKEINAWERKKKNPTGRRGRHKGRVGKPEG